MLRILHLEDDPVDAGMVLDLLREDGLEVESDLVDTLAEFREQVVRGGYGLILSDYTVPGLDSMEALGVARQFRPEVPFIFISGTMGEDKAIEALKLGASDYVLKQRIGRLVPCVRRALQEAAAQEALRRAGEELRVQSVALQSAANAISITDRDGTIQWVNAAFERLTGYSAAELRGQNHRLLRSGRQDAALYKELWDTINAGRVWHGEIVNQRKDGSLYREEMTIAPVRDAHGETTHFIAIKQDITERKRAEEALRLARDELEGKVRERTAQLVEANANLQTFTYSAAHDFRSPLRCINNFSGLVLEDCGAQLPAEDRAMLERVVVAADQMTRLLNDLLEYSKMSQEELRLERVSLRTTVSEALGLLDGDIRAKSAVVTVADPLPEVWGHSATVALLINNLVSNALKFVAPGVQPQIRIAAEQSGGWVRLFVQDNGIGIAREHLEKIFGGFQRLHGKQEYPGTGLGLAIVRKGAERMGGRVGAESEEGKGSRFWVELRSAEGGR